MSHRNIPGTNQMTEYQVNQAVQGPLPHGPVVFGGNSRNLFQPNAHLTLPVPVNTPIIDGHHLSEQYSHSIPYGIPPYSAFAHHPAANLDIGATAAPSLYNPYMNPGPFSAPPTYGPYEYMPYHGVVGIPSDEFVRNSFLYGFTTKGKNADIHGNFQNVNALTSTGSTADASNNGNIERAAAVTGSDQFLPTHYTVNPISSAMEEGPRVSVGDRPRVPVLDPAMVPVPSYMVAASYLSQPFIPPGHVWYDQPHSTNQGDVGIRPWSQLPATPILPGGNVSRGARDNGAMGVLGYPDLASNSSTNFLPHIRHGSTPLVLPPPMQVVGAPNVNFFQVAGPSYRGPANTTPHVSLNPPQESLSSGLRLQGTVLPTGIRVYRPHRGTLPDATVRSQSVPYLRVMPRDEVAELVIPDNYEEVSVDQHRDMRLDIEHMSYEELLALGDRIGNVSTGLTVEAIRNHLKTKVHIARSTNTSLEKLVPRDHDFDSCIICQSEFEDKEVIGILSCRHEYHAACLEKWLLVKNVCPVCKSSALVMEDKPKV
uniref:RING-type E3 ubiquitin transferase n=1 Tax=Kalanchoe fedtschenkoi TaxID=63787 RepID=A0A7N1A5I6_KALFE